VVRGAPQPVSPEGNSKVFIRLQPTFILLAICFAVSNSAQALDEIKIRI